MTTITTPAASDGKFRSDWATLGPWYAAEILNSFSVLLAVNGTYFYARYHLHVSAATLLWLPVCGGVPYVLAALLAGRIADRIGQRKLIQMMQVLNIPVFVLGGLGGLSAKPWPAFFTHYSPQHHQHHDMAGSGIGHYPQPRPHEVIVAIDGIQLCLGMRKFYSNVHWRQHC